MMFLDRSETTIIKTRRGYKLLWMGDIRSEVFPSLSEASAFLRQLEYVEESSK